MSGGMWLMKVPRFLMEHWSEVGPNKALGSLAVASSSDSQPQQTRPGVAPGSTSYTLRLADEAAYPPDIPREFAVTVAPAPGAMYVLSQPKSGKEKEQDSKRDGRSSSVVVEGKVELKGEVSAASLSKEYKELMTKRREQAEKRPEVQPLQKGGGQQMTTLKRRTVTKGEARESQLKQPKVEVPQMSREKLQDVIFEKFSQQKAWHRKDLMDLTGQKQKYLTEVLEQVCERGLGKYKGQYVLKSEYRNQSAGR